MGRCVHTSLTLEWRTAPSCYRRHQSFPKRSRYLYRESSFSNYPRDPKSHVEVSQGFTVYIPLGPYFVLELLVGGAHTFFTVLGVFKLQQPAIRLVSEEATSNNETNDKATEVQQVIPPPSRRDIIKLGLIALALSQAAALSINFFPKWPL